MLQIVRNNRIAYNFFRNSGTASYCHCGKYVCKYTYMANDLELMSFDKIIIDVFQTDMFIRRHNYGIIHISQFRQT